MNPDIPKPPREELEVRLTALLLGELPAEEAAALRELVAKDPQLAGLHERLKHAINLVHEAAATADEPATEQVAPLRLSGARREKLLAHFKTVAPKEFVPQPRRREWSWVVPLTATAAALVLLAAITMPNFTRARENGSVNSVLNNLRILEGAKDQWALENKKSGDDVVTLGDLTDYLKDGTVKSVLGEQYKLGRVSDPVTAEVDASRAKKTFGALATKQPQLSGQPARAQRARLNANGELTFVEKNAQASIGAPSGRESSVILTYSSEKQVEANLRAPSESHPLLHKSSRRVFLLRRCPPLMRRKEKLNLSKLDLPEPLHVRKFFFRRVICKPMRRKRRLRPRLFSRTRAGVNSNWAACWRPPRVAAVVYLAGEVGVGLVVGVAVATARLQKMHHSTSKRGSSRAIRRTTRLWVLRGTTASSNARVVLECKAGSHPLWLASLRKPSRGFVTWTLAHR